MLRARSVPTKGYGSMSSSDSAFRGLPTLKPMLISIYVAHSQLTHPFVSVTLSAAEGHSSLCAGLPGTVPTHPSPGVAASCNPHPFVFLPKP